MSIFIETQSWSVALTFSLHIKNIDFHLGLFTFVSNFAPPLIFSINVGEKIPSFQDCFITSTTGILKCWGFGSCGFLHFQTTHNIIQSFNTVFVQGWLKYSQFYCFFSGCATSCCVDLSNHISGSCVARWKESAMRCLESVAHVLEA